MICLISRGLIYSLGLFSRCQIGKILFYLETGFDILCKLPSVETICMMEAICMKYQILFSGKNKKKYFSMLSAENLPRVLSINYKEDIW